MRHKQPSIDASVITGWNVEVGTEVSDVPIPLLEDVGEIARWTLRHESAPPVELSVALLSDEAITAMNEEYLHHTGPTDVVSFPMEQPGAPLVGDVYIGYAQALRQAAEYGVPAREEVLRLVVHGTLHILGWEHPEGEDRADSPMHRRQEELLTSYLHRY
jgi:probable rRNA maturation factor